MLGKYTHIYIYIYITFYYNTDIILLILSILSILRLRNPSIPFQKNVLVVSLPSFFSPFSKIIFPKQLSSPMKTVKIKKRRIATNVNKNSVTHIRASQREAYLCLRNRLLYDAIFVDFCIPFITVNEINYYFSESIHRIVYLHCICT